MASKFKWEYDFADTIRVICGLMPKKQPPAAKFDPWDIKTYKVEDCHKELLNYEKMLKERGLKDPWIRVEVPQFHMMVWNMTITRWQYFGRMIVPGIICGSFLAYLKMKYFTWHDYEGRAEKWKHYH